MALSTREQYMLDYLTEEFSKQPEVRIREVVEDNERGVSVKTEAREYFFPFSWSESVPFREVYAQVQRIKDALGLL